MIIYLKTNTQIFQQTDYNNELNKLRWLLEKSSINYSMLHGDFSPHNCLFEKDNKNMFNVSTILDPSARAWYWISFFDIVYLFNTRWNKDKNNLKKGFLQKYNADTQNLLFIQFEKIMRMYLIEIYYSMWDIESSNGLKNFL